MKSIIITSVPVVAAGLALFFSMSGIQAFTTSTCPRPRLAIQDDTTSTRLHVAEVELDDISSIIPMHRTLYDVLNANPAESRDQLKKRYVELAKKSHPDAVRSSDGTVRAPMTGNDAGRDFTEIATAWRILSDPKQRRRYDRSLQAEQFTQDVAVWADKHAAPVAVQFGKFAMPFLRKTTATTSAMIQGAASETKRQPDTSWAGAFRAAMEAAQQAGRRVDKSEFTDKAARLEIRAAAEKEEAARLRMQFEAVVPKRLRMSLRTPGSGLTSAEALSIMNELNSTVLEESKTMWDRARMKRTLDEEITHLEAAELAFVETQQLDTQAQNEYQSSVQRRLKAKKELVTSEREEEEARRRLERAVKRANAARVDLDDITRALAQSEVQAKKSDYEMEQRSLALVKQSERVRSALRVKDRAHAKLNGGQIESALEDVVSADRLKELKELRREERLMQHAISRHETMAARLTSRANKLKGRAEELENMER